MRSIILVVACILFALPVAAQRQTPVPVFVTSAGATSELTDPNQGNADTVKDLRGIIKSLKTTLVLVDKRDEAVIVLVVMGRDSTPAPGTLTGVVRHIYVRLQCKDVDVELSDFAPTWGWAARDLVKQVERWVVANWTKLTERPQ